MSKNKENIIDMTGIYTRIKENADNLGLSGKDLGEILGLKKSPLTDWKNKKSAPTLEQLVILCETFAVSTDYIIFGSSSKNSSMLEQKLIQIANSFPDSDLQELINYADYLSSKKGSEKQKSSNSGENETA